MGVFLDEGKKRQTAALAWVKSNPEALNSWLEGVTTKDGGDALAAVRKHLDL
jgi:glycine betaine/proline transport system substrate-binding protein